MASIIALVVIGSAVVASTLAAASRALSFIGFGSGLAFFVRGIGSIIGAILTPIGLVIVPVAALAACLVYATDVGSQALSWPGDHRNPYFFLSMSCRILAKSHKRKVQSTPQVTNQRPSGDNACRVQPCFQGLKA